MYPDKCCPVFTLLTPAVMWSDVRRLRCALLRCRLIGGCAKLFELYLNTNIDLSKKVLDKLHEEFGYGTRHIWIKITGRCGRPLTGLTTALCSLAGSGKLAPFISYATTSLSFFMSPHHVTIPIVALTSDPLLPSVTPMQSVMQKSNKTVDSSITIR